MRMSLRVFLMKMRFKLRGLLLTPLFFFCFSLQQVHSKPDNGRHNVLFIAIDDLNDWVGCLKTNSQARTPNIDRLASRGVLFTNAHCQAPICNPSRTSLMLGLRPSTTGIYLNRPWFRNVPKNKNSITLTQYFGKFDYETLATGKIFHGSRVDELSFKRYGPRPGQMSGLDKKVQKNVPSPTKLWDFGPQNYSEEKHSDYKDASWAIDQLKKEFTKPFFLAVGFYRPHVPLFAPVKYFNSRPISEFKLPEVNNKDRDDLPNAAIQLIANPTPPKHEWFVESGKWIEAIQAYHACVTYTDHQVGRLLDALDASPYSKNTIIVLFSDHGFHLGEKQSWAKRSLWERSTKVPLIISVPGGIKGGRCSRPVELLSLFPTLNELCGLPKLRGLEGISVKSLLDDPDAEWTFPALTTFKEGNHSVRSERFRYIRYADGSEELYDHLKDPKEWVNLASNTDHKAVIINHANMLDRILKQNENQIPHE